MLAARSCLICVENFSGFRLCFVKSVKEMSCIYRQFYVSEQNMLFLGFRSNLDFDLRTLGFFIRQFRNVPCSICSCLVHSATFCLFCKKGEMSRQDNLYFSRSLSVIKLVTFIDQSTNCMFYARSININASQSLALRSINFILLTSHFKTLICS